MNILQIGTIDTSGGAAHISWEIKKALEKKGHTTSMFVADKLSKDPNVHVIPRTVHRYFSFIISDDTSLFSTDWILETPEFQSADIVHCHNLHGFYFNLETLHKMSLQKPIVWTLHDMWAITPHCAHAFDGKCDDGFFTCPSRNIYPRIIFPRENHLKKRKRNIYKKTPMTLVSPSQWLADKVQQSALKEKDLKIIQNGIDLSIFTPTSKKEAREELGLPQGKTIILILAPGGSKDLWKGWTYSYRLMKEYWNHPDIHFIYIGTDTSKLSGMNNVSIIEPLRDKKKLASYYSASDTLLYPSLADNCPLVVQESMACGTPVIAFNTGGIPELINDKENGFLVEYKNAKQLIDTVKEFNLLKKEERETLSAQALKKAQECFVVEQMIEEYINLYTMLIHE